MLALQGAKLLEGEVKKVTKSIEWVTVFVPPPIANCPSQESSSRLSTAATALLVYTLP